MPKGDLCHGIKWEVRWLCLSHLMQVTGSVSCVMQGGYACMRDHSRCIVAVRFAGGM